MSKQSPTPFALKSELKASKPKVSKLTLKLRTSVIQKNSKPKLKKARSSVKPRMKSPEDRLETLASIEREYIKTLINIKKSYTSIFRPNRDKTPEKKPCKRFKRKKNSIEAVHRRKESSVKKYDSTCSSPKSDKISHCLADKID